MLSDVEWTQPVIPESLNALLASFHPHLASLDAISETNLTTHSKLILLIVHSLDYPVQYTILYHLAHHLAYSNNPKPKFYLDLYNLKESLKPLVPAFKPFEEILARLSSYLPLNRALGVLSDNLSTIDELREEEVDEISESDRERGIYTPKNQVVSPDMLLLGLLEMDYLTSLKALDAFHEVYTGANRLDRFGAVEVLVPLSSGWSMYYQISYIAKDSTLSKVERLFELSFPRPISSVKAELVLEPFSAISDKIQKVDTAKFEWELGSLLDIKRRVEGGIEFEFMDDLVSLLARYTQSFPLKPARETSLTKSARKPLQNGTQLMNLLLEIILMILNNHEIHIASLHDLLVRLPSSSIVSMALLMCSPLNTSIPLSLWFHSHNIWCLPPHLLRAKPTIPLISIPYSSYFNPKDELEVYKEYLPVVIEEDVEGVLKNLLSEGRILKLAYFCSLHPSVKGVLVGILNGLLGGLDSGLEKVRLCRNLMGEESDIVETQIKAATLSDAKEIMIDLMSKWDIEFVTKKGTLKKWTKRILFMNFYALDISKIEDDRSNDELDVKTRMSEIANQFPGILGDLITSSVEAITDIMSQIPISMRTIEMINEEVRKLCILMAYSKDLSHKACAPTSAILINLIAQSKLLRSACLLKMIPEDIETLVLLNPVICKLIPLCRDLDYLLKLISFDNRQIQRTTRSTLVALLKEDPVRIVKMFESSTQSSHEYLCLLLDLIPLLDIRNEVSKEGLRLTRIEVERKMSSRRSLEIREGVTVHY